MLFFLYFLFHFGSQTQDFMDQKIMFPPVMDCTFVSLSPNPPNVHVEILIPHVMILGKGVLWVVIRSREWSPFEWINVPL